MDIDAFAALTGCCSGSLACSAENKELSTYSDRLCPAEDTFRRVSPLLETYGVTRIARQTGLDRIGIPVWSAMRPNSLSLAVNQGKGIGDVDAKVSAVMEALERAVAGEPEVPSRAASREQMQANGLPTDPVDALIGQGHSALARDEKLPWVEGYDLIAQQAVWVPRDSVMLDRTVETRFWQSSDGLASGNTPLEATFHGLLERIERDADTLWSLAKTADRTARCIDPAHFRDPVIDMLVSKIRNAGLLLQVFDITSDVGISCFQALIGPDDIGQRQKTLYLEAANGSGCHPDPVRAVIRAITEAAQSRLTLVSGSRDDIAEDVYRRPMPKNLIDDFRLKPSARQWPPRGRSQESMAAKLRDILQALKQRSIPSAIAVPLNALDAEFSVVKVFVTGLENPPGDRRTRFGARALNRMMSVS